MKTVTDLKFDEKNRKIMLTYSSGVIEILSIDSSSTDSTNFNKNSTSTDLKLENSNLTKLIIDWI